MPLDNIDPHLLVEKAGRIANKRITTLDQFQLSQEIRAKISSAKDAMVNRIQIYEAIEAKLKKQERLYILKSATKTQNSNK